MLQSHHTSCTQNIHKPPRLAKTQTCILKGFAPHLHNCAGAVGAPAISQLQFCMRSTCTHSTVHSAANYAPFNSPGLRQWWGHNYFVARPIRTTKLLLSATICCQLLLKVIYFNFNYLIIIVSLIIIVCCLWFLLEARYCK